MKSCSPHLPVMLALAFSCVLTMSLSCSSHKMIRGAARVKFESGKIDALLDSLSRGQLEHLPQAFYGEVYDDELPDLVIIVDRRGKTASEETPVRIDLLKGDKRRDELFGERFIYVLVFVAEDSSTIDSVSKSSNKPVIKMSSLDRRVGSGEFALFTAVKMIVGAVLGRTVGERMMARCPPDTQAVLHMIPIGEKTDASARLYHGRTKLPLAENTINRIRLEEVDSKIEPQATFGNYSSSWVTSSIGLMGTFLSGETARQDSVNKTSVEPFILGHLYIMRPQRPKPRLNRSKIEFWRQISFSLVTGTRLSEDLFDDIFVGVSVGHVISTLSIVGGYNFRTSRWSKAVREEREGHYAVGITFIL